MEKIKTKMRDGHHVIYDKDGSEFVFAPNGQVHRYLAKGYTLKPPSKADAEAVRVAKAEKGAKALESAKAAKAKADLHETAPKK